MIKKVIKGFLQPSPEDLSTYSQKDLYKKIITEMF